MSEPTDIIAKKQIIPKIPTTSRRTTKTTTRAFMSDAPAAVVQPPRSTYPST